MARQSGIAIDIKAFLPTGKSIDEQFAAFSMVKDAHASGDYTDVLKLAQINEVKTVATSRIVADAPDASPSPEAKAEDIPEFIKGSARKIASE